ncbi:hypothetical protein NSTCB13_02409 [Nostoc sp. DSM 114160]|jgi:hypothetical protein
MRLKNWKNLFFCILLTSSGGSWCCIRVDAAESAITHVLHPNHLATTQLTHEQLCHKLEQKAINSLCKLSSESHTLELIRKENLKDTQLVTRSEFQRISIFLTQIPEILARQVLYLSLQISS